MFPQQRFKPTHQALLLAMIAAAYPALGYGFAGRLDFVIGRVTAVGVDGKERVLVKGSEINAGDAVNTGADGRAQIHFSDGAFMSLQPGTTFRVNQYNYDGKTDGTEKGFFSLLKGGLRTITGAIGHGKNRDAYQVATPAATIGIRGTGYNAQLGNSLTVSVGEGAISLMNKGGELILKAGQTGYVKDFNTSPQLTFEKPSTPPASISGNTQPQTPPTQYGTGNGPGGGTGNTVLTDVVGLVARDSALVYGSHTIASDYPGTAVMDSTGNRVYFQDTSGTITGFSQATLDKSLPGAAGYDGIIGWGRWYGTVTYFENGVVTTRTSDINSGLHGIVAIPTAILPTRGTFSYALTGATRPTDGFNGPGTPGSGLLEISFSSTSTPLITTGSYYTYTLGSTYTLNLGLGTSTWNGSRFAISGATVTGGSSGGTASVQGVIAGTNAERVGMTFETSLAGVGVASGGLQHGAVVFSKSSCSGC